MARRSTSIDLRELALSTGHRVERVLDVDIAPIVFGGQSYQVVVGAQGVRVTVDRVSGGFLVHLSFDASVYGPCFRCLNEASLAVQAKQEEFVPLHPEEWGPGDVSPFVDDLVVDVEALAREALILALPGKILCSDGCPGVCPSCGREAHEGPCEGVADETDPRWACLRNLALPSEDTSSLKTDGE